MATYYLEIESEGVVPDEEWIKVFRFIQDNVVGEEALIRIEFGTVDEDGVHTGDFDLSK